MLSTVAVERLGIPKVHVTDGPNGARGEFVPRRRGHPFDLHPLRLGHRRDLEPAHRRGSSERSSGGKRSTAGAAACWLPR